MSKKIGQELLGRLLAGRGSVQWCGTTLLLGVESEWAFNNVKEIEKDFLKLLRCSASPRKLIITDSGKSCFNSYAGRMLEMLRVHGHIAGTRYLWFDIHGDLKGGGRIDIYEWPATRNGLQDVALAWPNAGQLPFRFFRTKIYLTHSMRSGFRWARTELVLTGPK